MYLAGVLPASLLKQASKVSGTHCCASGEAVDGKIAPEVVRKPGEQIAEGRARRNLGQKRGAELRLAAWPPQKHHHHSCHFQCG